MLFCTRGTGKRLPKFENQSRGTGPSSRKAILTAWKPKGWFGYGSLIMEVGELIKYGNGSLKIEVGELLSS